MDLQRKNRIETGLKEGKSLKKISEEEGLNYASLWSWCKRNSVGDGKGSVSAVKSIEMDLGEVEEMYRSGLSVHEIGRRFKTSGKVVWKRLKAAGVETRSRGPVAREFDEEYFSVIDTGEKAYWLGMMFSDGYVLRKNNVVGLTLKDREHVEKFRLAIKREGEVRLYGGYFSVTVNSKKMASDLSMHGVVPNKSFIVKAPSNIVGSALESDFWRGVFDGDGSISFSGRERTTLQVRICSASKVFIDQCAKFVRSIGIVAPSNFVIETNGEEKGRKTLYVLQLYSDKAAMLLERLYVGTTVFLERKREKYEYWKRAEAVRSGNRKIDVQEIEIGVADEWVKKYHSSKRLPNSTRVCVGGFVGGVLFGVATFGFGMYPKQTSQRVMGDGFDHSRHREIGRLCFAKEAWKGFGSEFLSKACRFLFESDESIDVILSWSNGFLGKVGYVYQSANFFYAGHVVTTRYMVGNVVVLPSSMRVYLQEAGGGHQLPESFMSARGIRLFKGKQFLYAMPRRKDLVTEKMSKSYPKEEDLLWWEKKNGRFAVCRRPVL